MKQAIRKILWPILKHFENGEIGPNYKKSYRAILIVVGVLFLVLSSISVAGLIYTGELGALIPAVIFSVVAFVSLTVGTVGSDKAVSRIWGDR
ncbi:hypothetical protein [Marinobacter caseinilyticus]|uniref:hypothetical protein n=1 Tax=Marinobacter caseinilyticus TaxID=2692195 RepID=UPI0014086E24|nr:hypothetical protein [Marinobacter caseinilyticus]